MKHAIILSTKLTLQKWHQKTAKVNISSTYLLHENNNVFIWRRWSKEFLNTFVPGKNLSQNSLRGRSRKLFLSRNK